MSKRGQSIRGKVLSPRRLVVRTLPFRGNNRGSNPPEGIVKACVV